MVVGVGDSAQNRRETGGHDKDEHRLAQIDHEPCFLWALPGHEGEDHGKKENAARHYSEQNKEEKTEKHTGGPASCLLRLPQRFGVDGDKGLGEHTLREQ